MNQIKYQKFYPGVYSEAERVAIERFEAGETFESATDAMSLVPSTEIPALTLTDMLLYAKCWDRYNPLYNDKTYAANTWYGKIPAIPCAVETTARASLPKELGDITFPPEEPMIGDGYDHEMQYYLPIVEGDSFTVKPGKNHLMDITAKEGSEIRAFVVICEANLYNQRDELAAKAIMRWPEFRKRALDEKYQGMDLRMLNPFPAKQYERPAHVYTTKDWDYLRDIWDKEYIRGSTPLYWEDVSIGDEPAWVAEGPITQLDMVRLHGYSIVDGGIVGGSIVGGMPLREWFEEGGGAYVALEDGTYRSGFSMHFSGDRPEFYNVTGRNHVIRMVTNWCGDTGFITKVGWRMVNDMTPEKQFDHFPENYFRPSCLLKVPYLREQGRFLNTHGKCPDCAIAKGYVIDKYVENGEHLIELACWCEDMDGNIHTESSVTIRLPSRRA